MANVRWSKPPSPHQAHQWRTPHSRNFRRPAERSRHLHQDRQSQHAGRKANHRARPLSPLQSHRSMLSAPCARAAQSSSGYVRSDGTGLARGFGRELSSSYRQRRLFLSRCAICSDRDLRGGECVHHIGPFHPNAGSPDRSVPAINRSAVECVSINIAELGNGREPMQAPR